MTEDFRVVEEEVVAERPPFRESGIKNLGVGRHLSNEDVLRSIPGRRIAVVAVLLLDIFRWE